MKPNPLYTVPTLWGWCMDGNEKPFAKALFDTAARSQHERFKYLELGPAKLGTMRAVCSLLSSMGVPADVLGMELPRDPFGTARLAPVMLTEWWQKPGLVNPALIYSDTRELHHHFQPHSVDVVFIDACHCEECATRDFINVEKIIAPWGTVLFHDASPACQEWDKQMFHEARPLRVRKAVTELGLLDNKRKGWRLVADLKDLHNGCVIVERV